MSKPSKSPEDTRELVRKAYGDAARKQASCCGGAAPDAAAGDLGLSCGDPVAFSRIRPGDIVLDLGSGAGKDVFLAARLTGPSGRVIGVDMTDDMLALARRNAEKLGMTNVEFRHGNIEALPLEDASVDLVISNCVVNLSPDKGRSFREAFRVLRSGGRLVVSDIVLDRPLPAELQGHEGLYTACIAGALPRAEYLDAVSAAGFRDIELLAEKGHAPGQAQCDPVTSESAAALEGTASSVTIFARKG